MYIATWPNFSLIVAKGLATFVSKFGVGNVLFSSEIGLQMFLQRWKPAWEAENY